MPKSAVIEKPDEQLLTLEMIADLRKQARFLRDHTKVPYPCARRLDDVADAMEHWHETHIHRLGDIDVDAFHLWRASSEIK